MSDQNSQLPFISLMSVQEYFVTMHTRVLGLLVSLEPGGRGSHAALTCCALAVPAVAALLPHRAGACRPGPSLPTKDVSVQGKGVSGRVLWEVSNPRAQSPVSSLHPSQVPAAARSPRSCPIHTLFLPFHSSVGFCFLMYIHENAQ